MNSKSQIGAIVGAVKRDWGDSAPSTSINKPPIGCYFLIGCQCHNDKYTGFYFVVLMFALQIIS